MGNRSTHPGERTAFEDDMERNGRIRGGPETGYTLDPTKVAGPTAKERDPASNVAHRAYSNLTHDLHRLYDQAVEDDEAARAYVTLHQDLTYLLADRDQQLIVQSFRDRLASKVELPGTLSKARQDALKNACEVECSECQRVSLSQPAELTAADRPADYAGGFFHVSGFGREALAQPCDAWRIRALMEK